MPAKCAQEVTTCTLQQFLLLGKKLSMGETTHSPETDSRLGFRAWQARYDMKSMCTTKQNQTVTKPQSNGLTWQWYFVTTCLLGMVLADVTDRNWVHWEIRMLLSSFPSSKTKLNKKKQLQSVSLVSFFVLALCTAQSVLSISLCWPCEQPSQYCQFLCAGLVYSPVSIVSFFVLALCTVQSVLSVSLCWPCVQPSQYCQFLCAGLAYSPVSIVSFFVLALCTTQSVLSVSLCWPCVQPSQHVTVKLRCCHLTFWDSYPIWFASPTPVQDLAGCGLWLEWGYGISTYLPLHGGQRHAALRWSKAKVVLNNSARKYPMKPMSLRRWQPTIHTYWQFFFISFVASVSQPHEAEVCSGDNLAIQEYMDRVKRIWYL